MSRKKALKSMRRLQAMGFYKDLEMMPVTKVHFAVAYNNYGSDKESIKRLLKGEKIIGKQDKKVTMVYGYGKLLGIIRKPQSGISKAYLQYVIYDMVILVGKEKKDAFSVYNEAWIKLGNWVNETYPRLDKVKVVFT